MPKIKKLTDANKVLRKKTFQALLKRTERDN